MKQGKNPPLTGSGVPVERPALSAAELGSANGTPIIASAQKLVRRWARKRFWIRMFFEGFMVFMFWFFLSFWLMVSLHLPSPGVAGGS